MNSSFIESLVNSALKFLEKRINTASDKISASVDSIVSKSSSANHQQNNQQSHLIEQSLSRMEKTLEKIKDPVFSGEVSIDTTNLEKEMVRTAKEIKLSIKPVKTDNIEAALKMIYNCIKDQSKSFEEGFSKMEETIKSISFNVPDTFKLEEMQLRKLAGASKGISVDGGKMAARNVAITNLALTATNTQYTFTFPANTTAFTVKLRDQGTLAYYSFTTGTLPVVGGGGDGTKYATIPQNFLQSQEGVDFSGKIIYFGAESASQIAEITVFTL